MLPSLHSVAFAVAIWLAPCQIQKLCSGTQPEEKPALKVKDKPTAFRGDNDIPTAFRGKVVELTDKAVTIKPEGEVKIVTTKFLEGGRTEQSVYTQDNTLPAHTFVFHGSLLTLSGKLTDYRGAIGVSAGHKMTDLQVGDIIHISCNRHQGVDYCYEVWIKERPGGRIPAGMMDGFFRQK